MSAPRRAMCLPEYCQPALRRVARTGVKLSRCLTVEQRVADLREGESRSLSAAALSDDMAARLRYGYVVLACMLPGPDKRDPLAVAVPAGVGAHTVELPVSLVAVVECGPVRG